MRPPVGLSYPYRATPEEEEAFNEIEKRSKVKQEIISNPSNEAKLIAEVRVLTEMVKVLSERLTKLESK